MHVSNKWVSFILIPFFLISACKQKSPIDKNIEEYVKKYFNNPDSYEPISTKCVDTTTNMENLKSLIEYNVSRIKSDSSNMEFWKTRNNSSIGKEEFNNDKKGFEQKKAESKKFQNKLDSIEKSQNPNSIYAYTFVHQCRAKVPMGGMMLKNIYIQTDKDFNIKMFDEGK